MSAKDVGPTNTVNGNCWQRAAEYMRSTAADFVVVQESRLAKGPTTDAAESTMAAARWKVSIGPCAITEAHGRACGVAVACKAHIGLGSRNAVDTVPDSKQLSNRLQLRHVGAAFRGGFHLGSMYCHSGIGIRAPANLRLLEEVAANLKGIAGPCIIGCDANCTPQALLDT